MEFVVPPPFSMKHLPEHNALQMVNINKYKWSIYLCNHFTSSHQMDVQGNVADWLQCVEYQGFSSVS